MAVMPQDLDHRCALHFWTVVHSDAVKVTSRSSHYSYLNSSLQRVLIKHQLICMHFCLTFPEILVWFNLILCVRWQLWQGVACVCLSQRLALDDFFSLRFYVLRQGLLPSLKFID